MPSTPMRTWPTPAWLNLTRKAPQGCITRPSALRWVTVTGARWIRAVTSRTRGAVPETPAFTSYPTGRQNRSVSPRGNGACVRVSRARGRVRTMARAGPAPGQDLVDKDREVSRDGFSGGSVVPLRLMSYFSPVSMPVTASISWITRSGFVFLISATATD
jgi:hypothetical protein